MTGAVVRVVAGVVERKRKSAVLIKQAGIEAARWLVGSTAGNAVHDRIVVGPRDGRARRDLEGSGLEAELDDIGGR